MAMGRVGLAGRLLRVRDPSSFCRGAVVPGAGPSSTAATPSPLSLSVLLWPPVHLILAMAVSPGHSLFTPVWCQCALHSPLPAPRVFSVHPSHIRSLPLPHLYQNALYIHSYHCYIFTFHVLSGRGASL